MNEDVDNITKIVNSLSKKGLLMTTTAHRVTSYKLHPHVVLPKGTIKDRNIQRICNDFEIHKNDALRRSKGKRA